MNPTHWRGSVCGGGSRAGRCWWLRGSGRRCSCIACARVLPQSSSRAQQQQPRPQPAAAHLHRQHPVQLSQGHDAIGEGKAQCAQRGGGRPRGRAVGVALPPGQPPRRRVGCVRQVVDALGQEAPREKAPHRHSPRRVLGTSRGGVKACVFRGWGWGWGWGGGCLEQALGAVWRAALGAPPQATHTQTPSSVRACRGSQRQ